MSAISATRRAMREMADGTIRVQIDIDPRFRDEFLKLFGKIDMPVALAPLVADFEKKEAKERIGALCMLAVQWCKEPEFWNFCTRTFPGNDVCSSEEDATELVKFVCNVESRKQLDSNSDIAERFNSSFRLPYMAWMQGRRS